MQGAQEYNLLLNEVLQKLAVLDVLLIFTQHLYFALLRLLLRCNSLVLQQVYAHVAQRHLELLSSDCMLPKPSFVHVMVYDTQNIAHYMYIS